MTGAEDIRRQYQIEAEQKAKNRALGCLFALGSGIVFWIIIIFGLYLWIEGC